MRVAITIEYNGARYVGWQKQNGLLSIQEEVEKALYKALNQEIEIVASGRTDAGVNAMGQVAHFDIETDMPLKKIKNATNFYLPPDIKIKDICLKDNDFHSRHSAKKKTYIYKMYFDDYASPLLDSTHLKLWHNIDVESMKLACKEFIGTYDCFGLCEYNPQVRNTVRTIYDCGLMQNGRELIFTITGNAFLHKMVRIIVGTIIKVGQGKIAVGDIKNIINSKQRSRAGQTAPAYALTLKEVLYE